MARSKWPTIEKNLFLIEMWCKEGMLEKDIAKQLGVSVSTFEEHKKNHPELRDALKKGKEIVDYEVENSLYKKCVGHYVKEGKAFKCKEIYYDENGNRCERETVQVVELDTFIPPDTLAMAMWLNNRRSDKWRRNANKEKLDDEKLKMEKEINAKKYW
ncbi:hypothetical protein [Acidaminobacter sp.]|uniref:hypothetical protein n=1 Tax=Acidaminobacter sp. TaxID=1872102 RepID=UPI00256597F5|nr:hypothetical protein [Acidaminobacter sp.]MDK9712324.1 hypothetical protein [Acidaminobacter sp.]